MALLPAFDTPIASDSGNTNDVNNIITAFDTAATGLSSPWTDETAGVYLSPTDADGRFFRVTLTAISTTNLEMAVTDLNGLVVCTRRIQIVSGPKDWWLSVSTHHVWIEIDNATVEALGAGLLDCSPDSQTAHEQFTWGRGNRNTSDADDSQGHQQGFFFLVTNGAGASEQRVISQDRNCTSTAITMLHGDGTSLFLPFWMTGTFLTERRVAGKAYNLLFGQTTGTALVLPIGTTETGTFRNSNLVQSNTMRIAVRTA